MAVVPEPFADPSRGSSFPVVFLNHVPWQGPRHRSHHFASRLAQRGHPVLYVETPVSAVFALRRRRDLLRHPWGRTWAAAPGVTVVRPHVMLPFGNSSRFVRRLNTWSVARVVRGQVARRGFAQSVVVCLAPSAIRLLAAVEPRAVAFDLADDYAAWPGQGAAARDLARQEMEALAARADVCCAVSRSLAESYGVGARRMVYLPNGADTAAYSLAAAAPADPVMDEMTRPIIGFVGMIHDFVELSWVRVLADRHPDWTIVLVGPTETDASVIRGAANIRLLGFQPYERLPSITAAFDVAIIPWKTTEAALGANPAKVWQYLAAGKPVVATRLPELSELADVVILVDDAGEFVAGVEGALRKPAGESERLRARAAAHDWDARTDVLEAELALALDESNAA